MSGAEFSLTLRVYIEDTDAGGIVYYVNYLKFMERARTEFMRAQGFDRPYLFNRELMFVVRDARISYHRPARLDDDLEATAALARLRGASLSFRQRVCRGGELLAEALVTVACVDRAGARARRLPPEMSAALGPLMVDQQGQGDS